jgi:NAD(P)-dependent dehydrogenase (short-subunit alcohol dehydrogenase family)
MEGLQNKVEVMCAAAGSIGTARHAHFGLMHSVAVQMAARRIRVNTLHPAAPPCAAGTDRRGRDVFGHAAQQLCQRQHAGCGWRHERLIGRI